MSGPHLVTAECTPKLIEHLEACFGPIESGWSQTPAGEKTPFQIVRFEPNQQRSRATFSTLGLSNTTLHSPVSGKIIRLELVLAVSSNCPTGWIPGVLQQVSLRPIESGHAALRGDVIGPFGPLFDNATVAALYLAIPTFLKEASRSVVCGDRDVAIAWVLPITAREVALVRSSGWPALEAAFDEPGVDLFDVRRTDNAVPC